MIIVSRLFFCIIILMTITTKSTSTTTTRVVPKILKPPIRHVPNEPPVTVELKLSPPQDTSNTNTTTVSSMIDETVDQTMPEAIPITSQPEITTAPEPPFEMEEAANEMEQEPQFDMEE